MVVNISGWGIVWSTLWAVLSSYFKNEGYEDFWPAPWRCL